ncbi:MAG: hypothetical protein EHM24_26585, partial [Acidobacteria bacterium]
MSDPTPAAGTASRRTEFMIVTGALVVAVVAAMAAQAGFRQAQPLVGLVVILGIAYILSTNRQAIDIRTVAWGLGLQTVFALLVLKTNQGQWVFSQLSTGITRLLNFANVGAAFVFGPLGNKEAWPRIMTTVLGPEGAQYGMIFAFQVLPTIIFIAALFA